MKRILVILLVLSMACAEGVVGPAMLSEEEENLLALLGMHFGVSIYDYAAPEGAKTATLTLWTLENGAWAETATVVQSVEGAGRNGRIAMVYEDSLSAGLLLSLWTPEGNTAIEDDNEPEFDIWSLNSGMESLWEETAALLNTEIPIALQIFSAADEMQEITLSMYANPESITDAAHVFAVTVSFLDISEEEFWAAEEDAWDTRTDWEGFDWVDEPVEEE